MLKIAVCDDDPAFLALAGKYVRRYCEERSIGFTVDLFDNADDFWQKFTSETYHIVLLDVIMPDTTGIELSKKVYTHSRFCAIAFISSSPDYAIEGYGVNAVGYLLKPPAAEKFAELMDLCLLRRRENRRRSLLFKTGAVTRRVDADKILYLESRNKQVLVHTDDETFVVSGKLSAIQADLPANFIQTHKSYIANLDRVSSMTREEMLCQSGDRIPISRQFHKEVSRRYLDNAAEGA